MELDCVILEEEGGIPTLALNRPEKMNVFDAHMVNEMVAAIENVAGEDEVRVLVITGQGKGFCIGGDVKAMKRGGGEQARPEGIS
jgi:enoyl-CoA hydratase/carnithine racemase